MEWKKSNISQSELEKQQQAYIKEALEMAKRSVASQFEKAAEIEKAKAEREAAEKIEAERIAAEKAEAERVAAEKAEAERIAAEKAEAERIAAEKAEAERIAAEKAEAERIAAEKAEAERIAAEKAEAERVAAKKAETERIAAEKAEAERIAAEKAEAERIVAEKTEAETLKEELTSYCGTNEEADKDESCPDQCLNLSDKDDIIDVTEVKKAMEPSEAQNKSRQRTMTQNGAANKKPSSPPNFNRFINEHNKSQCNCPNCQKRRAEQQR
ncbi:MAG: cell envelope integrity protein TolA [Ruminiclostridium sp.]|nr:cell envelope integrity protein TolA [Ruminiclostridium sp.]